MVSLTELEQVNSSALQKRLITPFSIIELDNYLGNLMLAPDSVPATPQTKTIMIAIIKEILIMRQIGIDQSEFKIPIELEHLAINDKEKIAILLDSVSFNELTTITRDDSEIPLASCCQLSSENQKIQGICICDFGLDEKQTIHLREQEIIRIPTNPVTPLSIELHLTHGKTQLPLTQKITIPNSSLGLIIDTRDKDILLRLPLKLSRQLLAKWEESLN